MLSGYLGEFMWRERASLRAVQHGTARRLERAGSDKFHAIINATVREGF